jgi:hypothetical protein
VSLYDTFPELYLTLHADESAKRESSMLHDGADTKENCQCGSSFAQLTASAIRRTGRGTDDEDDRSPPVVMPGKGLEAAAEAARGGAGPSGSG